MNINEFAKEVHQNAVAHGWWDEERTTEEIIALIHSEWSEALEEARAGMPMAYQVQSHGIVQGRIQTDMAKWFPGQKPEGIGVELVDGCIRILDYLGKMNVVFMDNPTLDHLMRTTPEKAYKVPLLRLVANLHLKTSQAYSMLMPEHAGPESGRRGFAMLFEAISIACAWLMDQGVNAEQLMLKKLEFYKGRPYKHGKKF